jgi:uncharacterized membrane protein YtjA (UPF0391 family)
VLLSREVGDGAGGRRGPDAENTTEDTAEGTRSGDAPACSVGPPGNCLHSAHGSRRRVRRDPAALRSFPMLGLVFLFLVLALLAGVFGFGLLGATALGFAKILFFVFLVLLVLSFFFGRRWRHA